MVGMKVSGDECSPDIAVAMTRFRDSKGLRESKCNIVAIFVTKTREQRANLTCMSALVDYTVELPKVENHCISNGLLCNSPLQGYVSTVLINIYRAPLIYKYIYINHTNTKHLLNIFQAQKKNKKNTYL